MHSVIAPEVRRARSRTYSGWIAGMEDSLKFILSSSIPPDDAEEKNMAAVIATYTTTSYKLAPIYSIDDALSDSVKLQCKALIESGHEVEIILLFPFHERRWRFEVLEYLQYPEFLKRFASDQEDNPQVL